MTKPPTGVAETPARRRMRRSYADHKVGVSDLRGRRYRSATNPPINTMTNIALTKAKRFSMKSRIGSPNFHNKTASKKNRIERQMIEAMVNLTRLNRNAPLAIVTILYGMGVIQIGR